MMSAIEMKKQQDSSYQIKTQAGFAEKCKQR